MPTTPYSINVHHTKFLKSASSLAESPPDHGIEVAFVGRSNSGKSSALNTIVRQKALARTSKTPGRTRMLNFFTIDDERRFVDLPGYGYAKVSQSIKEAIELLLSDYLTHRQCLHGLILLMDIRRPLTKYDKQLIDFVVALDKPVHILLTKSDKISRGAANAAVLQVRKALEHHDNLISVQSFSALRNLGLEQFQECLDRWFSFDE